MLGKYEQSVVEALKSNPDFKGYAKRIAKAFELAVARREALAAKEGELAQRDETVKELEARLQETAEQVTRAPAGPLSHLTDKEALTAEVAKAAEYLEWVKSDPNAVDRYQDTEEATAQQQLDYWQNYALRVLKHQGTQAAVLEEREKVRAEVKKQRPTLFDARHEENKLLTGFYKSDPRNRAEFSLGLVLGLGGFGLLRDLLGGGFGFLLLLFRSCVRKDVAFNGRIGFVSLFLRHTLKRQPHPGHQVIDRR